MSQQPEIHPAAGELQRASQARARARARQLRGHYLWTRTDAPRQMIFSTAPFDHEIVGYDTTLDVLLRDDWRREALHANHRRLKEGLLDLGCVASPSSTAPRVASCSTLAPPLSCAPARRYQDAVAQSDRQIISIITGGASSTAAFRDFCAERGVFGSVFCPPAAREGRSYLRFTINCAVTASQCEHFLAVMEDARPLLR